MFDFIATILAWLYNVTNSYGLAIMLLTLLVMVALTPLTLKGTRSMIAMQRLQPEIKRLQAKYKDDRQKLNEEMLKFYKENNINPVGGCLPLVLQMPVFFVLYRVLIGLTEHAPYGNDMGKAVGFYLNDPAAVHQAFGTFHPNHVPVDTAMYADLLQSREMNFMGLDLANSAMKALSEGFLVALPYLVLIGIIGFTAWYQQKQIQGRNPQAQQINPQQQAIMKFMPFFLPLISLTLPAGVVLYFLVSNLYRIGQQAFITKTMYGDQAGVPITTTAVDTTSTKPKGLLAQIKEAAGDGAPRIGKNAPGKAGAKPAAKNGAKGGAKPGAKGKGPRPPAKAGGSKAAPAKKQPAKSGAKAQPPKGAATKAPVENQATEAPAAADAPNGQASRPARPSRTAPAANPNRARDKKKRK